MNEDVVITKPFGNGKMTCREIRRNSAGCLKFRNECQKCKDIQRVGEPLFSDDWNQKAKYIIRTKNDVMIYLLKSFRLGSGVTVGINPSTDN